MNMLIHICLQGIAVLDFALMPKSFVLDQVYISKIQHTAKYAVAF